MDKRKIKIGIIGAYHHPNFGDQLLFNILSGWVSEKLPEAEIVVPWGDAIGIDWPKNVVVGGGIISLGSCDVVIFGGGGYLGEPGESARRTKDRYTKLDEIGCSFRLPKRMGGIYFGEYGYLRSDTLRFMKLGLIATILRLLRRPYAIIGVGLGPVTTGLGKIGVRQCLRFAEEICLRDRESVQEAKKIIKQKKMRETRDLVLSVIEPLKEYNPSQGAKIALHLGPASDRKIAFEEFKHLVSEIRKLGAKVTIISDCSPRTCQNLLPERLFKACENDVTFIPYGGVEDFISSIRQYDLVVTSKLHCGILAYREGVIPLSIAEHVKTRRFYRQAGLDENCFELSEDGIRNLLERLREILLNPTIMWQDMLVHRDNACSLANKNKQILESFLSRVLR